MFSRKILLISNRLVSTTMALELREEDRIQIKLCGTGSTATCSSDKWPALWPLTRKTAHALFVRSERHPTLSLVVHCLEEKRGLRFCLFSQKLTFLEKYYGRTEGKDFVCLFVCVSVCRSVLSSNMYISISMGPSALKLGTYLSPTLMKRIRSK